MKTIKYMIIGAAMAFSLMGCKSPKRQAVETKGSLVYLVDGSGLRTSEGFHTIERVGSQKNYFGRLGSLTYLLDKKGEKISLGFHEIELDTRHKAKLGACEYDLTSEGKVNSASSPSCLEMLTKTH